MKKSVLGLTLILVITGFVFAQGNAFSFQGKLNDGANPANGRYDLEFKLFDAIVGGNQIGLTAVRPNTVLINGVFSTTLDFGAAAFLNPNSIFIEIAVKPNGSPNALTILGPRQQLTVVPFASRAQNSVQLGGIQASEYITRTNGGADFIRNSTLTQPDSNFSISGSGTIGGNFGVGGVPTSRFQVFGNIKATGAFPKITLNETRIPNDSLVDQTERDGRSRWIFASGFVERFSSRGRCGH